MKALIRAQTSGTRLGPLTNQIPKPIIPVINRPSIEHAMRLLITYGIKDFVVSTHHQAELIEKVVGTSAQSLGCQVTFVNCPTKFKGMPWLEDYFDETFFALDCDIITTVDLGAMYKFHKEHQAITTVALLESNSSNAPSTTITNNGKLVRIDRNHKKKNYLHIIGVAIYEKDVFEYYKQNSNICSPFINNQDFTRLNLEPFSNEFFEKIPYLHFAKDSQWFGYKSSAFGIDIGKPNSYMKAHKDYFTKYKDLELLSEYTEIGRDIWVGKGVQIDSRAIIVGPVIIDSHSVIGFKAQIQPYSFISRNVIVGANTVIKQSIIWPYSIIGQEVTIINSVIPNNCVIGSKVEIQDIISIESGEIIHPKTKLIGNLAA